MNLINHCLGDKKAFEVAEHKIHACNKYETFTQGNH